MAMKFIHFAVSTGRAGLNRALCHQERGPISNTNATLAREAVTCASCLGLLEKQRRAPRTYRPEKRVWNHASYAGFSHGR